MQLNTNETYDMPTDSQYRTSGLVLLVRTLRTGDTISGWLTPMLAMDELMFSNLNGTEVVSGHVEAGEVSLSTTGISGSGLAVEWSMLRKPYSDLDYLR